MCHGSATLSEIARLIQGLPDRQVTKVKVHGAMEVALPPFNYSWRGSTRCRCQQVEGISSMGRGGGGGGGGGSGTVSIGGGLCHTDISQLQLL